MAKLFIGFLITFCLFQFLGAFLGSDRGQAGMVIGLFILTATLAFQWLISGGGILENLVRLGLGLPSMRGMMAGILVAFLLLATLPIYSALTGMQVYPATQWLWTVPGLFFQAGVAEETLFRGYLFGHLREGRTFWPAAGLSAMPFAVVHLLLFFTMPFPVATVAFLLSVVSSFPLAYLYDLGERTIWAPAIVHFVIQGAIKLVAIPDDAMQGLAIVWMAACAVIPWLAFLWKATAIESK